MEWRVKLVVERSTLSGSVRIPGSKSHTIRALAIAALGDGTSVLRQPLDSLDTQACVAVCRALGATVDAGEAWRVTGTAGRPACPTDVIDVANSGTTLRVALALAALGEGWTVFTGDEQIRVRPAGPLLAALRALGAEAFSTRGNGCAPLVVRGPLKGGRATLACPTSQHLTSLLIGCPLAEGDTDIEVTELNEAPYVAMTLAWLDSQGIRYEREGMTHFHVPGGQGYTAFERAIPADFSSATFFAVAAAVTGGGVTLLGLDRDDTQGDKAVFDMLAAMGAEVVWSDEGVRVTGGVLRGGEFDLNATPDALPAMAVAGLYAVMDMRSRTEPHCLFRVYADKAKADAFAAQAELLSLPYGQTNQS